MEARYEYNKNETIKHLSEKLERIKRAYAELRTSHDNHKIKNEELKHAVARAKKAMHYAVQKENFLRERIITKYGRAALADLLNHIDCPRGFDTEEFNKVTEKMGARQ